VPVELVQGSEFVECCLSGLAAEHLEPAVDDLRPVVLVEQVTAALDEVVNLLELHERVGDRLVDRLEGVADEEPDLVGRSLVEFPCVRLEDV
jgi:hypothetical protein